MSDIVWFPRGKDKSPAPSQPISRRGMLLGSASLCIIHGTTGLVVGLIRRQGWVLSEDDI